MKLSLVVNCLLMMLMLLAFPSYAVYEEPMDRNTTFSVSFDKASVPSWITIWNALSSGRDDTNGQKWGRNTLVCLSATDTTFGACGTVPKWSGTATSPPNAIWLKFTLQGTSTSVNLNVQGFHKGNMDACKMTFNVSSGSAVGCANAKVFINEFTYTIPSGELAKLTPAGLWTATLKQNVMLWPSASLGKTWTASIYIDVVDSKSQQIYFPDFPGSTPIVNLNLSNRPGTNNNTQAGGKVTLDMCLYDGKNSQSNTISMAFYDEGFNAAGREEGMFSVYRDGADKSLVENRIDYKVSVINPVTGSVQNINNNAAFTWTNINVRKIQRQVVLPGVPGISLCVPAPITLTTPAFKISEKNAGSYRGKITIIYTPTTQSGN